jgi:hypothetical protein
MGCLIMSNGRFGSVRDWVCLSLADVKDDFGLIWLW